MFSANNEEYLARSAALAVEIASAPDQEWRKTVDLRYGQFLVMKVINALAIASRMFDVPMAATSAPAMKEVAAGVWNATGEMAFACSLLAGNCSVKNPVVCEATIRLYLEAAQARSGAAIADVPPEPRDSGAQGV